MSYFEPSNHATSVASFIEAQRARCRELASGAPTLIIVGVKIRDHDRHIWDPIASTTSQVIYCAGPAAALEYEEWVRGKRPGHDDVALKGYFEDEFHSRCSHAGL